MADLTSSVKMPRRKKRIPDTVRRAAKEYKEAYHAVYGVRPSLSYSPSDGWITVKGMSGRVNVRRLRELTTQLRRRAG